ncbi:MAG TPA: single-stranded DNA-binding protein [archaeon]|nr:single-stranded DNA-binding protein [archaeon]
MKVSELKQEMKKIEITVKVEAKSAPHQIVLPADNMFHRVCEALVGDETGSIFLSLWDEQIENVLLGKYYKIANAYTSVYRSSLRLSTGKYGKIAVAEGTFEVNTANNLSMKEL